MEAMTAAEKAALDHDSFAYDKMLMKKGHLIVAEALQSPKKARTVSVRRGKVFVTDGPFAASKEQLGGFILLKASGLREAERIASGIPLARLGWIEVRQIYDFL